MKAQTSIEVLILLGGAIIVAIIVGVALKGLASNSANQAQNQINCTVLDCSGCKTTAGCSGYSIAEVKLWDGNPSNGNCNPTTSDAGFGSCKLT